MLIKSKVFYTLMTAANEQIQIVKGEKDYPIDLTDVVVMQQITALKDSNMMDWTINVSKAAKKNRENKSDRIGNQSKRKISGSTKKKK